MALHVQSAVSSPWTALICHALNPTPKSSPLMRSYLDPYLPACSRGGVDVICLSAHSYFRTHLHHNIPHTSTSTTAHTYSIFIFSLTPYSGLGTFIAYTRTTSFQVNGSRLLSGFCRVSPACRREEMDSEISVRTSM